MVFASLCNDIYIKVDFELIVFEKNFLAGLLHKYSDFQESATDNQTEFIIKRN